MFASTNLSLVKTNVNKRNGNFFNKKFPRCVQCVILKKFAKTKENSMEPVSFYAVETTALATIRKRG